MSYLFTKEVPHYNATPLEPSDFLSQTHNRKIKNRQKPIVGAEDTEATSQATEMPHKTFGAIF